MKPLSVPTKRCAAIHDLSCFGHTSLMAVIPILSAMGVQVFPLPTALLSSHSQLSNFHFHDLTSHMEAILKHWLQLNLRFDAIYSGFLGSHQQVDIVQRLIDTYKAQNPLVMVDPVLGDNGQLYKTIDTPLVLAMRNLVRHADIITPNLTELHLLLGNTPSDSMDERMLREAIKSIAEEGPTIVIVTSVPLAEDVKRSSVVAYSRTDNRFWKVPCSYLPTTYPGTGDAFASVITGSLLQGDSLPIALDRAVQFASMGVRATFGYPHSPAEGILLERILNTLNAPVQISSYEPLA